MMKFIGSSLIWVAAGISAFIVPGNIHAQDILTWEDCLQEAAYSHPDLIVAQEVILQSEEAQKVTRSDFFPQITAELNAATGKSSSAGSIRTYGYGLTGSQLLFDGPKTIGNLRSSRENIKATRENYRYISSEVRLRLRQAFINLLKAQHLLDLTRDIYQLRKDNLELIALKYESGTEHKGALLSAKANVSQATFEINQAQRGLGTAQKALIKELGRSGSAPVVVQGDLEQKQELNLNPDFETLALKTPVVLKLIAQKNAAAFDVSSRRGDFWPKVVLNGTASEFDDQWLPEKSSTSGGVKVTLPLFVGGANIANLAKAQSLYRQLEQQVRSTRDETILNLQKFWNQYLDAVEKVNVQKDFLAASEERAKISQAQYSVGLISFDNWTIIEDDLVAARKSFLDVQAAAQLAQAQWIQAKGETLEYEN